jgi:hypothetical protein
MNDVDRAQQSEEGNDQTSIIAVADMRRISTAAI